MVCAELGQAEENTACSGWFSSPIFPGRIGSVDRRHGGPKCAKARTNRIWEVAKNKRVVSRLPGTKGKGEVRENERYGYSGQVARFGERDDSEPATGSLFPGARAKPGQSP